MAQLKHVFQAKYHRSLEQTVKSDVSGYFEKLLVVCIQVKLLIDCIVFGLCSSSNVVGEYRFTISDIPSFQFSLLNRAPAMRWDITNTMSRQIPRHCTRQARVEWVQTSRSSSTSSPTDPTPTFDLSLSNMNPATAKSLARSSSRSSPDGSKLRLFTWVSPPYFCVYTLPHPLRTFFLCVSLNGSVMNTVRHFDRFESTCFVCYFGIITLPLQMSKPNNHPVFEQK